MPPCKLVINAIPLLGEQSGVGKYTQEIASRLAAQHEAFQATYYYGYYSKALCTGDVINRKETLASRLKRCLCKNPFAKRVCRKLLTVSSTLTRSLFADTYDVYFEPNFVVQSGISARHNVVTIHDFSCFLYPEWHPAERVRYMQEHLWSSLERADAIITVSEAMRREAIDRFGLDASRIVTISNGVAHERYQPPQTETVQALRRKWGLPETFVLYVGTIEPRKNIRNLLLAYAKLPTPLRERYPLVIAGGDGWNNADIHVLLKGMSQYVRMVGFVSECDLPALYGAASLFVYPSWYEGFGLPVLEAMACGCPVLTSNHAALQEVCGDAALCVAPGDVDALRDALVGTLEDDTLRAQLRLSGLNRAQLFNWDQSAQKHGELFQSLCKI